MGGLLTTSVELETLAPATLSATGAFTNVANLEARPGLLPFGVNSPLWLDGAPKLRWMAISHAGVPDAPSERMVFSETGAWKFPVGTVFVKNFEWLTDQANPLTVRRLETRFLVHGSDGNYYGLTYRWKTDGLEADLFLGGGEDDVVFTELDGGTRTEKWA
ncbi:MAG: hypothetical protein ACI8T1_000301 [Verrucomicrobiales bacterium]|jgi:hypothetical protein